ncbi:MAG TPA: hypothetical protein DER02_00080 [Gammaproteobacteria bacterium]|nr:hypothetical protein [Gammaproteobacteria bacterium]
MQVIKRSCAKREFARQACFGLSFVRSDLLWAWIRNRIKAEGVVASVAVLKMRKIRGLIQAKLNKSY